jgi:putative sigma-54 modulation protein
MYKAVDAAIDALDRQIRKTRTRLEKRLREGAFDAVSAEDRANEEGEFFIVRSKQFLLKPMDVEEAILQMNMIGHEFFMCQNAENNHTCVVYKRKNGGYGLIEPI